MAHAPPPPGSPSTAASDARSVVSLAHPPASLAFRRAVNASWSRVPPVQRHEQQHSPSVFSQVPWRRLAASKCASPFSTGSRPRASSTLPVRGRTAFSKNAGGRRSRPSRLGGLAPGARTARADTDCVSAHGHACTRGQHLSAAARPPLARPLPPCRSSRAGTGRQRCACAREAAAGHAARAGVRPACSHACQPRRQ